MNLVAVDPGVKATGIAVFEDNELAHVGLLRAVDLRSMIKVLADIGIDDCPDAVVVERPTVYHRGGKGDPNDLVSIAIVAGAAAALLGGYWRTTEVVFVEPRTWKGSVLKDVHNIRIIKLLNKEEHLILNDGVASAPTSLVHNVVDAVGLGLYQLGRI